MRLDFRLGLLTNNVIVTKIYLHHVSCEAKINAHAASLKSFEYQNAPLILRYVPLSQAIFLWIP